MSQKILLIDDREDNLFSLETILEADGYEFVKARSGRDALKILLVQFDFALILMDVQMPNLNGFETAALIFEREKLKHIPIIFITANTYGEENIFKGYRTGGVDYIYKPIKPELLRARVSVFIDLYKKNQQLLLQEKKLLSINNVLQNEISERKNSEAQVIELNKELVRNIDELERANKDLDRFAFMASHDLQEPLRKIRAFSEMIAEKHEHDFDEEDNANLGRIQQSAARLQELIKDILSFSKIAAGPLIIADVPLDDLLAEVLAEMDQILIKKNARVIVGPLPELPVNAGLLKTVFFNLLSNAVKYGKDDTAPVIEIYADERQPTSAGLQNNYCRVYVKDNGIGFDPEYAEKIFEMFRRLHTRKEYPGTGIGLALCKKILDKHGGYITAISKEKKGSTFIISLPYQQPEN
ncbi:MAG: ATP-binding protein [Chitinophagaceae bacterium]